MVLLETNYLKMHWTDLHQVFRICAYMGGRDQPHLLFAIAQLLDIVILW